MLFLIQPRCEELELEKRFLLDAVKKSGHMYVIATMKDIQNGKYDSYGNRIIPFGTIKYVEKCMKRYYGVDRINPMEIPVCLRQERFLKRKYDIVEYKKLPEARTYFIKDVSRLKSLVVIGNKQTVVANEGKKSHFYQCSEYISDIISEYRIYFIDGKIENICNYNGDPTVFPNIALINEANGIFMSQSDYPKSYTMDVMVSKKGTAIIELHPFISVGLYATLWGRNLATAYIDGVNYLQRFNTKCY